MNGGKASHLALTRTDGRGLVATGDDAHLDSFSAPVKSKQTPAP